MNHLDRVGMACRSPRNRHLVWGHSFTVDAVMHNDGYYQAHLWPKCAGHRSGRRRPLADRPEPSIARRVGGDIVSIRIPDSRSYTTRGGRAIPLLHSHGVLGPDRGRLSRVFLVLGPVKRQGRWQRQLKDVERTWVVCACRSGPAAYLQGLLQGAGRWAGRPRQWLRSGSRLKFRTTMSDGRGLFGVSLGQQPADLPGRIRDGAAQKIKQPP